MADWHLRGELASASLPIFSQIFMQHEHNFYCKGTADSYKNARFGLWTWGDKYRLGDHNQLAWCLSLNRHTTLKGFQRHIFNHDCLEQKAIVWLKIQVYESSLNIVWLKMHVYLCLQSAEEYKCNPLAAHCNLGTLCNSFFSPRVTLHCFMLTFQASFDFAHYET